MAAEQDHRRAPPRALGSPIWIQRGQLRQDLPPAPVPGVDQHHQIGVAGPKECERLARRRIHGPDVGADDAQRHAALCRARRAAQPQVLDCPAVHEREQREYDGGPMVAQGERGSEEDQGGHRVLQPEMAEQIEGPPHPRRERQHGGQHEPGRGQHQDQVQGARAVPHADRIGSSSRRRQRDA